MDEYVGIYTSIMDTAAKEEEVQVKEKMGFLVNCLRYLQQPQTIPSEQVTQIAIFIEQAYQEVQDKNGDFLTSYLRYATESVEEKLNK